MGNFDGGEGHKKTELIIRGHTGSWVYIPTHAVRAGPSLLGVLSEIYWEKMQIQNSILKYNFV